jgi:hypothetical protein
VDPDPAPFDVFFSTYLKFIFFSAQTNKLKEASKPHTPVQSGSRSGYVEKSLQNGSTDPAPTPPPQHNRAIGNSKFTHMSNLFSIHMIL